MSHHEVCTCVVSKTQQRQTPYNNYFDDTYKGMDKNPSVGASKENLIHVFVP